MPTDTDTPEPAPTGRLVLGAAPVPVGVAPTLVEKVDWMGAPAVVDGWAGTLGVEGVLGAEGIEGVEGDSGEPGEPLGGGEVPVNLAALAL